MSRGRKSNERTNNMLGLLGMDGGNPPASIEDDADLNAELEALLSGQAAPAPARRRNKGGGGGPPAPKAEMSLEAQVALAMRDVPQDMDVDNLEDDAELMAELQGIIEEEQEEETQPEPAKKVPTGCSVATIEDRLDEYRMAVATAESIGETSRACRFQRGMQSLEAMLTRARAGHSVPESDLPPPPPTASNKPSPTHAPAVPATTEPPAPKSPKPSPQPAPQPSSQPVLQPSSKPSPHSDQLPMLTERRDQYKVAALQAKRSGAIGEAKRCVQVAKQFDSVIGAIEAGQPVDLSNIPPPPGAASTAGGPTSTPAPVENAERQRGSAPAGGLSLEDDLKARMAVMQKTQQKAQEEGNASKARRLGRQVTAYKEAIGACKAGRPYDYSELALPPGFEPLKAVTESTGRPAAPPAPSPAVPAPSAPAASAPPSAATGGGGSGGGGSKSLLEDLQARMAAMKAAQAKAQQEENSSKARRLGRVVAAYQEAIGACKAGRPYTYSELALPPGFPPLQDVSAPAPAAAKVSAAATSAGPAKPTGGPSAPGKLQRQLSRSTNQTLVFLQERQRLFKEAALKARNEGKKDLALTYLRQSKGFEPMITAAENGLPVDMSKLPNLPGEKEVDFEFLRAEECDTPEDLSTDDPKKLYQQLAAKLQAQLALCRSNSSRCSRMGDVTTASKFDRLLRTCQLDLGALKSAESHGDPVPRFHFEWKTFTLERTNPDLGDDAMELQLVRGIDLAVPQGFTADQMDTYLRAELPLPSSEEPQVFTTEVVRRTNNPEFNATHKFNVNKKQRTFQRLVKSRAIKVEVFYKRGFLKGDKVLGVASVKLTDLEGHCELHDSFDLMDGRKAVGGRVEVRVRLREPVTGRQVEETREKWLVVDASARPEPQKAPASGGGGGSAAVESVEVMRYERDLLMQKMKTLSAQLTPAMTETLNAKRAELERKITAKEQALRSGGPAALKAYSSSIVKLAAGYNAEAREMLKGGDRNKASILMTKKKLVEKEAASIKAKLGAK